MFSIVFAKREDRAFCATLDPHISEEEFLFKIAQRRYYILRENLRPAGVMRYNLFWDTIPCLTLLFLEEGSRGKGYGRAAMEFWEHEMHARGYGMVLTTTQVDEQAQHFYRRLGYRDCGCMTVDIPRYAQPAELFMAKEI